MYRTPFPPLFPDPALPVSVPDPGYPSTGNGWIANLDGHARPEYGVPWNYGVGVDIAGRNPVLEVVDADGNVLSQYRYDTTQEESVQVECTRSLVAGR